MLYPVRSPSVSGIGGHSSSAESACRNSAAERVEYEVARSSRHTSGRAGRAPVAGEFLPSEMPSVEVPHGHRVGDPSAAAAEGVAARGFPCDPSRGDVASRLRAYDLGQHRRREGASSRIRVFALVGASGHPLVGCQSEPRASSSSSPQGLIPILAVTTSGEPDPHRVGASVVCLDPSSYEQCAGL